MSSIQMYDDADHRTHFTGFLLEEEVVASFWKFLLVIQRHEMKVD
jgi:hypothetical protein